MELALTSPNENKYGWVHHENSSNYIVYKDERKKKDFMARNYEAIFVWTRQLTI